MKFDSLLSQDAVLDGVSVRCGKQMLEEISRHASRLTGLNAMEIFDGLVDRERLGSTAIGKGAAIPHTRIRDLKKPLLMFARLKQPVNMEAPDDEPVDLVFCLLVPEQANGIHLKALARVSKFLANPAHRQDLRDAPTREAIYQAIIHADTIH